MMDIAKGQLRVWARSIRHAANDLFLPREGGSVGQVPANMAGDVSVMELLRAERASDAERWLALTTLWNIARALDEAADS